jgi:membrane protease YdiL (CAAX protease family)
MAASARVLQDLMFVYFALHNPALALYRTAQCKTAPARRAFDKARFYRRKTTIQWLETLSVVAVMNGLMPLCYAPTKLAWNEIETWFLVVLVAGALAWILSEIVPSPWRAHRRETLMRDLQRLARIVPETPAERQWWLWVCVTAGVCEELVYRGFLIRYLHQLPHGLMPVSSLLLSSIVFAAIHAPHGPRGVLHSGIVGMMLGGLFLLSGNLLLPMMVHALANARILWIRANTQDKNSNLGTILT